MPTLTADANTSAGQYAQPTLQLTTDATLTSPVLGPYAGDDVTVNLRRCCHAYTVTACSRSTPTPFFDEQVDRRDDPHPERGPRTDAIAALRDQQARMFRKTLTTAPTTLP